MPFFLFQGMYISDYYSLCVRDSGLLDVESVPQCIVILKGLRTLMQCLMVNESLCWMVYNCTIIMYSISRSLMSANYSVKVRFIKEVCTFYVKNTCKLGRLM